MDYTKANKITQNQNSLIRIVPAHENLEAEKPMKDTADSRSASPAQSDSTSSSDKQTLKNARIGIFKRVKEDGRVKQTEKIFKIIKEKDFEVDSDDESSSSSDDISRSCEIDKDMYKSVYKKSKKLIKHTLDSSCLKSTRLACHQSI